MIFHNATNILPNGPTVAEFGKGDIIINVLKPAPGEDYPFGVSMANTSEATPPGTDRPEHDGKTIDKFEPQVIITFTHEASFDAVISRLQLAKQAFLDAANAQAASSEGINKSI